MRIVTNSQEPHEPKNPDDSVVFEIYRAFANESEQAELRQRYVTGIGWGEAKQILFEKINAELTPAREKYLELTANPHKIEEILQFGAEKVRKVAKEQLAKVRDAIGIRTL